MGKTLRTHPLHSKCFISYSCYIVVAAKLTHFASEMLLKEKFDEWEQTDLIEQNQV